MSYYDENADLFVACTLDADMQEAQTRFRSCLAPGARILDVGCGSGRDSKAFQEMGYQVEALDASSAMVDAAAELCGWRPRMMRVQDLEDTNAYDGIWACASLLHVPRSELADVLGRLDRALRPGGVLYASFKLGIGERTSKGRTFTNFTLTDLSHWLSSELDVLNVWESFDVRPERANERWVNGLARKR